jgi:DNA-binding transcriptional MerR regulator
VKQKTAPVYRIQEFARLAGLTDRALHHYDHLGLLKPVGRRVPLSQHRVSEALHET